MAVFDDTKPWTEKVLLYPHEILWKNNIPVPAKAEPEKVVIPEMEPLRSECEHFLHCIATGKTPLTDGREGLSVLKILNASQRSLEQNGKKIVLRPEMKSISRPSTINNNQYYSHPTAVSSLSLLRSSSIFGLTYFNY